MPVHNLQQNMLVKTHTLFAEKLISVKERSVIILIKVIKNSFIYLRLYMVSSLSPSPSSHQV